MNTNLGRVSENALFSLLLIAVIGWTAAQVIAAGSQALGSPAEPVAAAQAVHHS